MPLPEPNSEWPPKDFRAALRTIAEWSAWYSGEPDELRKVYGGTTTSYPANRPSQFRGGLVGAVSRMIWGRPTPTGEADERLHIPLAGDIATISADLLFAEPVTLTAAQDLPDDDRKAQQVKLEQLGEQLHPVLLEAAEVAAGLGGVYLRDAWDQTVADGPWTSAVHADAAIPEFRYGRLAAVTFWWVIERDEQRVVRHLERHELGVIEHGVYDGTADSLGKPAALGRYAATRLLEPAVATGIDVLTAGYVPNMRPNRAWRSQPQVCHLGRSDYGTGTVGAMGALDEAWTSLMRDLDLGRARAILPSYMLEHLGPGQGAAFAADRRYFVGLNMPPNAAPGTNPVTLSQPLLRVAEHLQITQELMLRVISSAGYSAQSLGLAGEVAITATEVTNKRERSLVTRGRKELYWVPEIAKRAQALLMLGNKHFDWGLPDVMPAVSLADAVQPDLGTIAAAVEMLARAEAASIEQRVRYVHPDWDDDLVLAEVARIKDDTAGSVPAADVFGQPSADEQPDGEDAG